MRPMTPENKKIIEGAELDPRGFEVTHGIATRGCPVDTSGYTDYIPWTAPAGPLMAYQPFD